MDNRQIAPVYEDFQPTFEWADENQSSILYIYVPGFTREQLKIMYVHSNRIIRVVGEKPLGNNRWSRFNQAFNVPDNCEVTKIHAKFQHGILTITLPKSVVPPPPPKQEVKPTPSQEPPRAPEAPQAPPARPRVADAPQDPPARQKVAEPPQAPPAMPQVAQAPPADGKHVVQPTPQEPAKVPPTARIHQAPKQDVTPSPKEAAKVPPKARVPDVPKPEEVQEAMPSRDSVGDSLKDKVDKDGVLSRKPEMSTSDYGRLQKEKAPEAPQKSALGTDGGRIVEEMKEKDRATGEATIAKKPEKVTDKTHSKEKGVGDKGKESARESALQKASEKVESDKHKPNISAQEKSKSGEFIATTMNGIRRYAAGTKQTAQSFANMLKQEDENKQLMVNVGAAAMVIMALGAYISYSFLTKGKDDK